MAKGKIVPKFKIICQECDKAAMATRPETCFCSQACRTSFTNRRRDRGAVLYDLFMAHRYDRDRAKEQELFKLMCRAAEDFHRQDKEDGRRSWVKFEKLAADGRFVRYAYEAKGRV